MELIFILIIVVYLIGAMVSAIRYYQWNAVDIPGAFIILWPLCVCFEFVLSCKILYKLLKEKWNK